MVVSIILLVLGAISSAIFIVSKVINYSFTSIVFKTIASLFFLALAIVCVCLNKEGNILFRVFAILGLFFGLLGDVFLGFKYITTKTKNVWVMLGMFAFAFGHIFYIIALFNGFYIQGNVLFIVLPFVTPIVIISIYMVIAKKVGIHFPKGLVPFGIFYLYCLTSMFSTAFYMACLNQFAQTTIVMFFIGSLCFGASDFMLMGSYFKDGERSKAYRATYSIFYYLAQFIIAFSLFFLI